MRDGLTDGLSFVGTRLAITGETKIRDHEIEDPKTVQSCLGYDANALYLFSLMQTCPSGYFTRYKEEDNFKPDMSSKYGFLAYEYLS